ncbi:MAG: FIST N-terminal domain-containing protein, partial [Acidobacteriota bacterium]
MFNYLAFIRAGLTEPGASPATDGNELATDCLQQLKDTGNPEQFPPRLLILLTSPAYESADELGQMLIAIRQTFADYKTLVFTNTESEPTDVPLIGSSVEAVFFNRQVHDCGALLVCLASRMVEAQVCASRNLRNDHEHATHALLEDLGLNYPNPQNANQKPLTGRLLMTFFPNIGRHEGSESYLAPRLHQLLLENSRTRIPIVGGASSRPGFQFHDGQVCHDEMVAAKISSGAPFSSSFGHGLNETDQDLRVKDLADDGHTVLAFDQPGDPAQILGLKHGSGFGLLSELSLGHDPMVTVAEATTDGKSVTLLRKIKRNALFRRLAIGSPEHVRSEAKRMFENSLKWWMLERPIGCLAIHCSSRRRSGVPFQEIVTDAEEVLRRENTRYALKGRDLYFGGYFDGEAGMDESGRPLFGNWCLATLCFSDEMDEMRERTPAHTGF